MRSVLYLPISAVSLLVACAVAPGESTTSAEVVSVNRIASNRIASNRIASNRIASNRIASNRLSASRLTINMETAAELLATDDGRAVFSLIVGCAIPEDVTLTANVGGVALEFTGELGLAPQWLVGRLDQNGARWVSACMFSRVNAHEVAIPVSLRGPNRQLEVSADEREAWTLEEGAFYGNAFGPLNQPIQWFACRGRDKAAGDSGGLADRECAAPDPANPGFTLCGFMFAGDCGDFARDRTCEGFSARGTFYEDCRTSPLRQHRSGYDRRDRGRDCDSNEDFFTQVITTFATP